MFLRSWSGNWEGELEVGGEHPLGVLTAFLTANVSLRG